MEKVYIIAEAGVNHNGEKSLAFELIDAAIDAGADAVKFQTFKAENIVTKNADKAIYQKKNTNFSETHFEMLKRMELPYETHYELADYCKEKNIEFLSTAFDLESLNFLTNQLELKTFKIPSGEITNGPLLLAYAQTGCNLILSTGMSTLDEIEEALKVIAFGLVHGTGLPELPSIDVFNKSYNSSKGQMLLKEKVTLLHCTSEYPAPLVDINLKAIETMRNAFSLKVGYSDHSEGIVVPISAASLGATVIEKHFTLDKTLIGPDHKMSLNLKELKDMVAAIRSVEQIMGDGIKKPKPSELKNIEIVRKSLVAACDIIEGNNITADSIAIKRPGTGKSPMGYWDIIGKESPRDFTVDEEIY